MDRFDFLEVQNRACHAIESAGRDGSQMIAALQRLHHDAECQLSAAEEFDDRLIDCRAGCGSCCVVNVSVLVPEGMAIAAYLDGWPDREKKAVVEHLDELWRAVRGLTDEERISLRQRCVFLDGAGQCRIYTVRPILCRSVTSISAEDCLESLVDAPFSEPRSVMMNLFQRRLYEAVYIGVGEGLQKSGLDGRSVKLTGLVRTLLKQPGYGKELLSGKKIDWHDLA